MEMTLESMAAFGRTCQAILDSKQTPPEPQQTPQGWPPFAGVKQAGALFNISPQSLRELARQYQADGFPVVWLGKKMLVDVPGLYDWLHDRHGQRLTAE